MGKIPETVLREMKNEYIETFNKYRPLSVDEYDYWAARASLLWFLVDLTWSLNKKDGEFEIIKRKNWGTASRLDRLGTRYNLILEYKDHLAEYLPILKLLENIMEFIIKNIGDLGEIETYKAFEQLATNH